MHGPYNACVQIFDQAQMNAQTSGLTQSDLHYSASEMLVLQLIACLIFDPVFLSKGGLNLNMRENVY